MHPHTECPYHQDVDWRNNVSFATSSMDHMIYVCKLGEQKPIKAFRGHTDEAGGCYMGVLHSPASFSRPRADLLPR